MSRHHRLSDWLEFSARARREGKSLREASTAWRAAHMRLRGSPLSPEGEHHHRRRQHVGGLLRKGVPFERAIRSNPGPYAVKCPECRTTVRMTDDIRESYQGKKCDACKKGGQTAKRNPQASKVLVIGGLAVGLWYLLRQQRPGGV